MICFQAEHQHFAVIATAYRIAVYILDMLEVDSLQEHTILRIDMENAISDVHTDDN